MWHSLPVLTRSRARAGLVGVSGRHSPKANSYQLTLITITSPLSPTLSPSAGARWDLGSGAIRDRTRCVRIFAGLEAMWPHTGDQVRIGSGGTTDPRIRTSTPTPDGKGLGLLRPSAGERAGHGSAPVRYLSRKGLRRWPKTEVFDQNQHDTARKVIVRLPRLAAAGVLRPLCPRSLRPETFVG